ncbi:hypothetical protein SDC9_184282 [bioreactor metagenome]|uniref:Uncharacterized protein n=1 Tax=bioreactor metagenome TaxID=1076179 RepID=A0A645HCL6_9ZZZZ
MGLGEAEVRERLDLGVEVVGGRAGQPVAGHPGIELPLQRLDPLDPPFGAHRPAQQVGVLTAALPDRHRHLHQLFLEDRHPEGALQHRLELGMGVRDRLLAELAADERVHRPALDGARPDQGDLDHQVVEPAGP